MSTAAGQSSDRAASIFVMGTMMGVAVAGAGALALSYYTRMERERFAADARERYARGSRRHSSEGIKDPSGTSAQRERMGRYRRSAGMIASAQVANMLNGLMTASSAAASRSGRLLSTYVFIKKPIVPRFIP